MSKANIKSTQPKTQGAVDWTAVGRRIRELRGFDMTQAEFARRVGVTQGHLSRLERGEKEPGAGVLLAISREFGKSVDWLLTGKTHVEPKKGLARDSTPPE
jgi:transcriptional regulator with XRE-family HTH domain